MTIMIFKTSIIVKLDNMFHTWQKWHPHGVVYDTCEYSDNFYMMWQFQN